MSKKTLTGPWGSAWLLTHLFTSIPWPPGPLNTSASRDAVPPAKGFLEATCLSVASPLLDFALAPESHHFNLSSISLVSEVPCSPPPCCFPVCYRRRLMAADSWAVLEHLDNEKLQDACWLPSMWPASQAHWSSETPSYRRQPNSGWWQMQAWKVCFEGLPVSPLSRPPSLIGP